MSDYKEIIYEKTGAIVKVTLNRPNKLNALTDSLMLELSDALDTIQADSEIRVMILTGAGRAFSAGYDLSLEGPPRTTVQAWRRHATECGRDVVMKIWDLRMPVISAVNGYALGGGCDLALVTDITLVADDAKLGEPEVRMVSAPPTLILPYLIGMKKTKELLLTGDMIDAEEAYRLGIANKVVPADQLQEEAWKYAEKLAAVPPVSLEYNKRAINHAFESMGMKTAIDYGVETFTQLLMTEEASAFATTVMEKGLKAALAERDREFKEE